MMHAPARPHYDARTGFYPRHGVPQGMWALAKITHDVDSGRPTDALPLTRDLLRADAPAALELGTDCWLDKRCTDVVVLGSAHATTPVQHLAVSVSVGAFTRRVLVLGRRFARLHGGRIVFDEPEPFTTKPMGWDLAYGGIDPRVPLLDERDVTPALQDHPGLYPRNPFGKGYLVEPLERELELPCLEDPDDLLIPERLVTGNPRHWYRQPLPITLGYAPHNLFARYVHLGVDAWFTPPDDVHLPEVRRGMLPAGFRKLLADLGGPGPGFWQEAAPGLALADVRPGMPIIVRGMHPEGRTLRFTVPEPPPMELALEGRRQIGRPQLSKLVILPATRRVALTWMARTDVMHRIFVPGIHAEIPLSVRLGKDAPIPYITPATTRAPLDAAEAAGMVPMAPRPRRPPVMPP